ncbi:MAG: hypothetical protein IT423_20995 [Pirellulaceae bacterium]|nr:hypothetical protein [Pirellulaceae bacterium]
MSRRHRFESNSVRSKRRHSRYAANLAGFGVRRGRLIRSLGAVLVSVGLTNSLVAGPPSILNMFQERSTAGSEEKLALQPEHGPWMILAMTLTGDDAEQRSVQLAKELQPMLGAPVYVHMREFDHSQPLAQAQARLNYGDKESLYTKRVRHANAVREKTYSVLVGNYTTTEDPRLAEMLQKVKTARPACLESKADDKPTKENVESKDTNWLISTKRMLLWQKNEQSAKKGRMGAAFVTRNPRLPADYFQNAVDDFVVKLNENVEHSLLKCKGRYTVRVATFSGPVVTQLANSMAPKKQEEVSTNALDEACLKAGELTAALRAKGVEAYEFHDRNASYVTIGSFDSLGEEPPGGGAFIYNPEMVSIMNQYCGYEIRPVKDVRTGQYSNTPSCKLLNDIPFDVEGKFISVPRPAASKVYQGSLLGKSRTGQ